MIYNKDEEYKECTLKKFSMYIDLDSPEDSSKRNKGSNKNINLNIKRETGCLWFVRTLYVLKAFNCAKIQSVNNFQN